MTFSSRTARAAVLILIASVLLGVVPTRAATGAPTGAAAIAKPNIVLILTDDQTMQSVAKMQYLQSWANVTRFNQAEDNNALCCPTRCTILQGRYDTHTGVTSNARGDLCAETETLPVWLKRAGYQSGLFGKYLNGYPFDRGLNIPPGWNEWHVSHGESMYKQYNWNLISNGVSRHYGATAADYAVTVLTDKLVNFVRTKAAAGQPFFAAFTPTATHSPWRASPARDGTFATAVVPRDPSYNEADVSDKPAFIRSLPLVDAAWATPLRRKEYEAAVTIDDALRRIDAALRTAGVLQETVVMFTTDNGFSFGNHRWRRKHCQYNECHKMPMLVRYPGVASRTDNASLISSVDIAPTIAGLAGATPTLVQDGRSFVPLVLNPATPWRDAVLQHHPGGDMFGRPGAFDSIPQYFSVKAYTSRGLLKYVELDTGERELYDQRLDPYELVNRAGDPAYAGARGELKVKLDALKRRAGVTPANSPLRTDMPVWRPGQPIPIDVG